MNQESVLAGIANDIARRAIGVICAGVGGSRRSATLDRATGMDFDGDVAETGRPGIGATSERPDMLELRPTCENCNKLLPANSGEARICSYECTFCAACVDNVLENVCPNCGGGFVARPVRPANNWRGDNFLGKDPASTVVRHRPVDRNVHARFSSAIKAILPHGR